ncbi:hypothetical protein P167DRAFT_319163 [Morchella conica CCBAS932]|uniref:Uncharacterized protein n=1 Tax=Morchella conica CCBAS932 TaxID=1392247 RepID=A0A3N4L0X7_9PEZI|nr:hypothetical protein P167DRAFT_319163 [Morchella conica CCBAS932]
MMIHQWCFLRSPNTHLLLVSAFFSPPFCFWGSLLLYICTNGAEHIFTNFPKKRSFCKGMSYPRLPGALSLNNH